MAFLLPYLFIYLLSLELSDLFISSINYITFSSTSLSLSPLELSNLFISSINYFTFSSTSLSLSSLELLDLFISPINYTPNFLFKSYAGIFFLVSTWSLQFYCCLSLKGVFFPFWFLISFARFHAFFFLIYLFGLSILLNIFIFWLLVFFVPLVL